MRKTLLKAAIFSFLFINGFLWAEAPYLDLYDPDNIQGGCTMFCETPKPSSAEQTAAAATSVFDGASNENGVAAVRVNSGTLKDGKKAVISPLNNDQQEAIKVARQDRSDGIVTSAIWGTTGLGLGALLGYGIASNHMALKIGGGLFAFAGILLGGALLWVGLTRGNSDDTFMGSLGLGLGILSAVFPVVSGAVFIGGLALGALTASFYGAKGAVQAHREVKALQRGESNDAI